MLVSGRSPVRLTLDVRVAHTFHTILFHNSFFKGVYTALAVGFLYCNFPTMCVVVLRLLGSSPILDPLPRRAGLASKQRNTRNRDEQYPHGFLPGILQFALTVYCCLRTMN